MFAMKFVVTNLFFWILYYSWDHYRYPGIKHSG